MLPAEIFICVLKKIDTLSFVFIIIGLLFFAGSIIIYFLNKKNKKSD